MSNAVVKGRAQDALLHPKGGNLSKVVPQAQGDSGQFDAAVAEGNRDAAVSTYKVAVKSVDRAVAKGLIHKNNAAHKKSSLTVKLNGLEG